MGEGTCIETKVYAGLSATAKLLWLNKKYFSFYSGMSFGAGIGMKARKRLYGIFELSFGYHGLVIFGVGYKL